MENASKAIVIAGAVLITMLVLTLIVIFAQNASSITEVFANEISAAEIENHNNKYLKFEGRISGAEVINAATAVLEQLKSNSQIVIRLEYKPLSIVLDKSHKSEYGRIVNNINKTKLYNVNLKYDSQGLINAVVVN